MGFIDLFFKKENNLNESIDYFKKFHPKQSFSDMSATSGEGIEELQPVSGFGVYGKNEVKSFNVFHNRYIDFQLKNERDKIKEYRNVARMPEVADVIEDVINESTQSDFDGRKIRLVIRDSELKTNDNITKLLQKEFDVLFNQRLEFNKIIEDIVMTYYVDGRVYWENVIDVNKPKKGLLKIKRLPTETMDFVYNVMTGKVEFFIQYLKESKLLPSSIEDAKKSTDLIAFWPEQIGYLDYGQYGANKKDVMGYLEKVKAPYNQVKLLETAVVIYRLVRAPERLVFTIDVGNMPRNKAMKFVEQIKVSMQRKEVYDPSSGKMSNQPDVMSILENYFLPSSCIIPSTCVSLLDGRDITMEKIIDEFNEGKDLWVYSVDQTKAKVIPGKIKWAGYTRKNASLVRVHLDNKEYIDCTPDHKFVLRNGNEIEAQHLKNGDSLMPLYRKKEKINGKSNGKEIRAKISKSSSIKVTKFMFEKLHGYYVQDTNITNAGLTKLLEKDREFMHHWIEINNSVLDIKDKLSKHVVKKIISGNTEFKNYSDFKKHYNINHKVIKVEVLPYRSDTCCLTIEDPGDNHNFALSCGVFIKNSEGRGSSINTIGGNPSGFTELDDLYFFHRKMYRALKYPMSRIDSTQEKQSRDNMYQATSSGEITRDEVKWGTFLKNHQDKFSELFLDLFMLHLALRGVAKEFGIKRHMLYCEMTIPNNYISQMHQLEQSTRWDNYSASNSDEFSIYWRMKKFLKLTDEEILANSSGFKRDKELGFAPADEQY